MNNTKELDTELENINRLISIAIEKTTERLLDELVNIIDSVVYSYSGSWADENRTYRFKDSWYNTVSTIVGNVVVSSVQQNQDVLFHDPQNWSHGNRWSPLEENSLNDIINNGLSSSNFGFPSIEARPFWSDFKVYCNNNIERIFEEQMRFVGL